MFDKNNPLFQDPHIDYPFRDRALSFADYANKCREIIEKHRCDLHNNPLAETIVQANSPFELLPEHSTGAGAVMLHGLYDSPCILRDIGASLQQQNLLVRAHLLPGHGTVPGALLNVTYEDWLAAADYAIHNLSQDVDRAYLVGFSTGASLLLHQYLTGKFKKIAGLVLLAPAIQLYSPLGFATGWLRTLGERWDRAKWFHIGVENDYAKYQSFTFNSAYQIYQLTKLIQTLSAHQKLAVPMSVVVSEDDTTVSTKSTLDYFQRYATPNSQLLLYSNASTEAADARVTQRPTHFLDWQRETLSHAAIPVSPDNSHYGVKGDYEAVTGKTSTLFNPDFAFMIQKIKQFIC